MFGIAATTRAGTGPGLVGTRTSQRWVWREVRTRTFQGARDESLTSKMLITDSANTFWAFEILVWKLWQGPPGLLGVSGLSTEADTGAGNGSEGAAARDGRKKRAMECKFLRSWTFKKAEVWLAPPPRCVIV